ncbi:hypothetical protein FAM09_18365 [Niastella caeni]|uniref:Uncharacterized protein n=1 Tax=Niastella caeni TaxID=2569763 RepID=A0A4S8HNH3_9BACT|nr:hypothetical protein [Niastella caeni]THU36928.1 hypothetical protein FAM09_18365 [Niastella caeni]
MKPILLVLLVFISIYAHSQQIPYQVQAKRGVFTERLFLKDRWIDRVSTDLNSSDSASDNVLATGKAIADFIRSKSGNFIQNQFSVAQPASLWLQGTAVMGSYNSFMNTLSSGFPARVYVTQGSAQHGYSVQRSSNDEGAAGLVFFKNNAAGFNTLNALQPGDAIGSFVFSGITGDNNTVANVMSMHGSVEKTASTYLSSGFIFKTTDTSGVYDRRMWLNAEGNLLIGNATTNPYKLNVASGNVRFNSLAGAGDAIVVSDNDGVLNKINLGQNLYIENGTLHAAVGSSGPSLTYLARLNQSGTSAPSAFVFENTIGTIVWTRTSTGVYTGTVTNGGLGEFNVLHAEASDEAGNVLSARLLPGSGNTVTLIIKNDLLNNMDNWTGITIEIRGYNAD